MITCNNSRHRCRPWLSFSNIKYDFEYSQIDRQSWPFTQLSSTISSNSLIMGEFFFVIMFSLNNPHIQIDTMFTVVTRDFMKPCKSKCRLVFGFRLLQVEVAIRLFFFDCKKWLSFFMKTLHYLKLVFRL